MPIHVHDAGERDPTETCEPPGRQDDGDVHELRDDEFFLEPDEPTLELPSSTPPSVLSEGMSPQLPRWAAASRVILDSLRSDEETTLELPPWGALLPGVSAAVERASDTDSADRAELARALEQVRAREAYVGEVELALAAASGRMRGQAFRIAELEAELEAELAAPHVPTVQRPLALVAPPRAEARQSPPDPVVPARQDLQEIDGIGPRFAERLAMLGIETFDAIASWKAADVVAIAQALGIGPARIKQQAWIKQARALRAKGAKRVRSPAARSSRRKPRSA
jgi:predicted flap endonuclease-1-like 5' DNA nuclease